MTRLEWMLGAMLSLTPGMAIADELSDKIAAAYELGRSEGYTLGWNECAQQRCGWFLPGGTRGHGTSASGATYQVPPIFFGGGGTGSTAGYELPEGWLVNATPSGPGLVGRVDPEGMFQPYVADQLGRIDLLPQAEVPVWVTDDAAKSFFKSLPKGAEGLVYVPVEPVF